MTTRRNDRMRVACALLGSLLLTVCSGSEADAICVNIVCSNNILTTSAPDQCGTVVTFPAPTPVTIMGGTCGTISCSRQSGAFFGVGPRTVTCSSSAGPDCSFTVTVFDTQPPAITAPSDREKKTDAPGDTTVSATFPPPDASDNCPGVTTLCDPTSGTAFPVGVTTTTCTATDASGNTASGSFTVTVRDGCIQDDITRDFLAWNSFTGAYRFTTCGNVCPLTTLRTGIATTAKTTFKLKHKVDNRSISASVNAAKGTGKATLVFTTERSKLSIKLKDTVIGDSTCSCS